MYTLFFKVLKLKQTFAQSNRLKNGIDFLFKTQKKSFKNEYKLLKNRFD